MVVSTVVWPEIGRKFKGKETRQTRGAVNRTMRHPLRDRSASSPDRRKDSHSALLAQITTSPSVPPPWPGARNRATGPSAGSSTKGWQHVLQYPVSAVIMPPESRSSRSNQRRPRSPPHRSIDHRSPWSRLARSSFLKEKTADVIGSFQQSRGSLHAESSLVYWLKVTRERVQEAHRHGHSPAKWP